MESMNNNDIMQTIHIGVLVSLHVLRYIDGTGQEIETEIGRTPNLRKSENIFWS